MLSQVGRVHGAAAAIELLAVAIQDTSVKPTMWMFNSALDCLAKEGQADSAIALLREAQVHAWHCIHIILMYTTQYSYVRTCVKQHCLAVS
jgi:pentatricopeptide repeat protein